MTRTMLLDTASLYFRAFHGVPSSVRTPSGEPANAVRGLADMLTRLVGAYRPDRVFACWDDDWRPQWRVDLVPSYKAQRLDEHGDEDVPAELVTQIPMIRDMLAALGVPVLGASQAEADDVIGTLAVRLPGPIDVVTGDRDLFQVVDDERDVRVIYTGRGMSSLDELDDAAVIAKHGVRADQYAEYAALRGDASDGLPGAAGIGEKTAARLLTDHGTLADALEAARNAEGMTAAVARKLLAAEEYLQRALPAVRVRTDLALEIPDASLRAPADAARAEQLAAEHGWSSALQRWNRMLALRD